MYASQTDHLPNGYRLGAHFFNSLAAMRLSSLTTLALFATSAWCAPARVGEDAASDPFDSSGAAQNLAWNKIMSTFSCEIECMKRRGGIKIEVWQLPRIFMSCHRDCGGRPSGAVRVHQGLSQAASSWSTQMAHFREAAEQVAADRQQDLINIQNAIGTPAMIAAFVGFVVLAFIALPGIAGGSALAAAAIAL